MFFALLEYTAVNAAIRSDAKITQRRFGRKLKSKCGVVPLLENEEV